MPNIGKLLLIPLLLIIIICWLFFSSKIPYFLNIWMLLGQPDLGTRVLYLLGFFFLIFILGIRVLKSGPGP